MSSSKPVRSMPDLVRLSKLDHSFSTNPRCTHHVYPVPGERYAKEREQWQRLKELGRGSYGAVYLEKCRRGQEEATTIRAAKDGSLRAVKVINKPKNVEYYRELEALSFFSYPQYERCFVKSFGWFEDSSRIYVAMEYLPLGDLEQYLDKQDLDDPLPESESRLLVSQIVEALGFMHENGFVHRDLKPANVLVKTDRPSWWIKIADFGLSKRVTEEFSGLCTTAGTPLYMAPEILGLSNSGDSLAEGSYTNAVDMWALGIISFLLLTGDVCFKDQRHLGRYVHGVEPFPLEALSEVGSEGAREFVQSLTAVDPHDRPSAEACLKHAWLNDQTHEELQRDASNTVGNLATDPYLSMISADRTVSGQAATPASSWNASADWSARWSDALRSASHPTHKSTTDRMTATVIEESAESDAKQSRPSSFEKVDSIAQATRSVAMEQHVSFTRARIPERLPPPPPSSTPLRDINRLSQPLVVRDKIARGKDEQHADALQMSMADAATTAVRTKEPERTTASTADSRDPRVEATEQSATGTKDKTGAEPASLNQARRVKLAQDRQAWLQQQAESAADIKKRFMTMQGPPPLALPPWLREDIPEIEETVPVATETQIRDAPGTRELASLASDQPLPHTPALPVGSQKVPQETPRPILKAVPPNEPLMATAPEISCSGPSTSKRESASEPALPLKSTSFSWNLLEKTIPYITMPNANRVSHVAFSPDSSLLAVAFEDTSAIMLYTIKKKNVKGSKYVGKLSSNAGKGSVKAMRFSSTGENLNAVYMDKTSAQVREWDLATEKRTSKSPLARFEVALLVGTTHATVPHVAALSQDGRSVVFGGVEGLLCLCCLESAKLTWRSWGTRQDVTCVGFSPDSQTVIAGFRGGEARLFRSSEGGEVQRVIRHRHKVWSVEFSQDGLTVLTVSGLLSTDGEVTITRVATGEQIATFPGRKATLSPDMTTLAICVDGAARPSIKLRDAVSGAKLAKLPSWEGWVRDIVLSPDGEMLATGQSNGSVKIWEASRAVANASIPSDDKLSGVKDGGIGTRLKSLLPSWKRASRTLTTAEESIGQKGQHDQADALQQLLGIPGVTPNPAATCWTPTPPEPRPS